MPRAAMMSASVFRTATRIEDAPEGPSGLPHSSDLRDDGGPKAVGEPARPETGPFRLIHDALQPPGTGAPVSVDIAHQAIRGPQGHVVAGHAVLPPVGFHTPAAHLLDDSVAMARDDQSDQLPFVPYELRGKRFGKESHAITSTHSVARSGRRALSSATRERNTAPFPSFARR